MAIYKDSGQFYTAMQSLFDRVEEEKPDAAEDIKKSKLILRFSCQDPEATVLINGRRNDETITFGQNKIRPEVDVLLKTDSLHKILLGDLELARALASKELRLRGPARKALALTDLFHECQSIYPEILREQGLNN
jgi:putative sterol carrier protein